jgi:hypothetical protein
LENAMPAAVIGGAIAAVGAIGSSVISSRGASAAANATTQAADQAAQVTRETYAQSAQALAPWQQQGLQANALLNNSLGIGGGPQQQIQPMGPQGGGEYGGGQFEPLGGAFGGWRDRVGREVGDGQGFGGYSGPYGVNNPPQGAFGAPQQPDYQTAFGNWLRNSDYAFQFANGANRVNSGFAGIGAIKSGAALKGMEDYRQGINQGYRGEYNALLGNQQSLGFGAASAQAGVSQNQGSSLAQIYQNRGDNIANARLVGAANTSNTIGSLAGVAANLYGRYG